MQGTPNHEVEQQGFFLPQALRLLYGVLDSMFDAIKNITKRENEIFEVMHHQPYLAALLLVNWRAWARAHRPVRHRHHGINVAQSNCMAQRPPRACYVPQQIPQGRAPVYRIAKE